MEQHKKRIGLIAAWGRYPVVVAEALVAQGYEVYCIAVKDHADEAALRPLCKEFLWNGVARYTASIRFLQRHAQNGHIFQSQAQLLFQVLEFFARRGSFNRKSRGALYNRILQLGF